MFCFVEAKGFSKHSLHSTYVRAHVLTDRKIKCSFIVYRESKTVKKRDRKIEEALDTMR